MELRQLRYFVAVAEELHFGRAARRLHMSQPPLSQQIRALEDEVGARLLERTSRSVALTEAGRAFLDRARDILAAADKAADTARAVSQGVRGRLAVGFVGPAVDGLLPPAILAFHQTSPDVLLELSELGTVAQLEDLNAGRLHAGFIRAFGRAPEGLALETVIRERYVLALPPGHVLARKRGVRLADLAGTPLVMYPRRTGPALYDAVMDGLGRAGVQPMVAQEALSKHVAVALVSAGLGAALVPESTARARRAGVIFRPLEGDLPLVEIAMIHDPSRVTPALERFMEAVRAEARRAT